MPSGCSCSRKKRTAPSYPLSHYVQGKRIKGYTGDLWIKRKNWHQYHTKYSKVSSVTACDIVPSWNSSEFKTHWPCVHWVSFPASGHTQMDAIHNAMVQDKHQILHPTSQKLRNYMTMPSYRSQISQNVPNDQSLHHLKSRTFNCRAWLCQLCFRPHLIQGRKVRIGKTICSSGLGVKPWLQEKKMAMAQE